MTQYASEMRLFDPSLGQRLYMDASERQAFLEASNELDSRRQRLFCQVLHWTGARLSEALALTGQHIDCRRKSITFQTLKKRKYTQKGELKAPSFRQVPVPPELINPLDLYFDIRARQKTKDRTLNDPLWPGKGSPQKPLSRTTGWRIIKRTMELAGIEGPQACPKGFRHGFGVAMAMGGMPPHRLQSILGHERADTTAIYYQMVAQEAHDMQMQHWKKANEPWER